MFARTVCRPNCAAAAAAMLLLAGAAAAGEKAKITPPASTKAPAGLAPSKGNELPFRPLDGASSVGGVVDQGTELPAVAPVAPDPRSQKEMFERLDRKRNFLLDDSQGDGVGAEQTLGVDDDENAGKMRTSRRPETLLERRLRNGNRTPKAENGARENEKKGGDPSDAGRDSPDLYRESEVTRLFQDSGSELGQRFNFGGTSFKNPASTDDESISNTLQDIRSALSDTGGRGVGFDALSRERIERYQQSSGDGGRLRLGLADQTAELGRTRESRLDAMDGLLAPASTGILGDLNSLNPADAGAGLPQRGSGLASPIQGPPNAYAPPGPLAAPASAPATRFLKEPRPEPPRFPL